MYDYRKMTREERREVLLKRKACCFPLHAPPHFGGEDGDTLISAACYEHQRVFDEPEALSLLMYEVLGTFAKSEFCSLAWVFLPTHYHVLLRLENNAPCSEVIRKMHGRLATAINGRQGIRGRRVWYRFSDRKIRDESHYWATLNYIHFNPVKHGFITDMEEWPWSSLQQYIEEFGRPWLEAIQQRYLLHEYGKGWDW